MKILEGFLKGLWDLFGYSVPFRNMLNGFDVKCEEYGASQRPVMFLVLILTVAGFYILHYYAINSASFNKKSSCWVMGILLALTNFVISMVWTQNLVKGADFCDYEKIVGLQDLILFSLGSAVYSFIIWAILTSSPIPRRFAGVNMNQTTLWKP